MRGPPHAPPPSSLPGNIPPGGRGSVRAEFARARLHPSRQPLSTTSPRLARWPTSCPSPPRGGDGGQRPDEGGPPPFHPPHPLLQHTFRKGEAPAKPNPEGRGSFRAINRSPLSAPGSRAGPRRVLLPQGGEKVANGRMRGAPPPLHTPHPLPESTVPGGEGSIRTKSARARLRPSRQPLSTTSPRLARWPTSCPSPQGGRRWAIARMRGPPAPPPTASSPATHIPGGRGSIRAESSRRRTENQPQAPPGKTGGSINDQPVQTHPFSYQSAGWFCGAPEWPVLRCPLTGVGHNPAQPSRPSNDQCSNKVAQTVRLFGNPPSSTCNSSCVTPSPPAPRHNRPQRGHRGEPGVERSDHPRSTPPTTPAPRMWCQTACITGCSVDISQQSAHQPSC